MLFNLFAAILGAALLSNIITQGIGLESVKGNEFRIKPVLLKAGMVSCMSFIVFLLDYGIYQFILVTLGFEYLNLMILTVLMISLNELYQLTVKYFKLKLPTHDTFGLHSVILMVGLLSLQTVSFDVALVSAFGGLIGFMALSVLFTMNISRMRVSPILMSYKGLPILLIVLGLIAMVLTGLGGIF
jgi:electron transport complex protein RnfA